MTDEELNEIVGDSAFLTRVRERLLALVAEVRRLRADLEKYNTKLGPLLTQARAEEREEIVRIALTWWEDGDRQLPGLINAITARGK